MSNPHEKATQERQEAAKELMAAYEELCDAADLYEPDEG